MNKKQRIIKRINEKEEDFYRSATQEYLKKYSTLNCFEIAIFSEVVYEIIVNHITLEAGFDKISKEYNINCKMIAFFAIMPIKIHKKVIYLKNINKTINYFFNVVKTYIVRETFKGTISI